METSCDYFYEMLRFIQNMELNQIGFLIEAIEKRLNSL